MATREDALFEPRFKEGAEMAELRRLAVAWYEASSELAIEEYAHTHDLAAVVNRCGVLSGPWQMGSVDQGFVALWAARHPVGISAFNWGGQVPTLVPGWYLQGIEAPALQHHH